MQFADQKNELLTKLGAIQTTEIPLYIAGKSTDKVRDSIQAFCASVQAYIDSLGDDGLLQQDDPCAGLTEEALNECLMEQIAQYGVSVDATFEARQLRNILNSLETVGSQIADCLKQLDPSLGYSNSTPQSAFKAIFADKT